MYYPAMPVTKVPLVERSISCAINFCAIHFLRDLEMDTNSATPLHDIPPVRTLRVVPEHLRPRRGCDVAPHLDGVRVVREDGDLFFIVRMVEYRLANGPRPDSLRRCGACRELHDVSIVTLYRGSSSSLRWYWL